MTELEKLDSNLKSLEFFVKNFAQLKEAQKSVGNRSAGAADLSQDENFQRRVGDLERQIRNERNRWKRQGAQVDTAYRNAFEKKVRQIESYVSSLGATLNTAPASAASIVSEAAMKLKIAPITPPGTPPNVSVAPPIAGPTVPASSAASVKTNSETEFPYISVLLGWGCIVSGTLGILYAACFGAMGVLAVASVLVFTGFGIMMYHGDKMFGTGKHAKTFKAIFTGLVWFLWVIFLLLKLFGNSAKNNKNNNRKNRR